MVQGQFQGSNSSLSFVTTRDTRDGSIYLTVVNAGGSVQPTNVRVTGVGAVATRGTATTLSGDPAAQNTLANPTAVVPVGAEATGLGTSFAYTFPAHSLTVLRLSTG